MIFVNMNIWQICAFISFNSSYFVRSSFAANALTFPNEILSLVSFSSATSCNAQKGLRAVA